MKRWIKIKGEKKNFIINCLAQDKSLVEIRQLCKKIHDLNITEESIKRIYKTHLGEVEEQKNRFLAASIEVPIAQERVRLERDEALYQLSQRIEEKKERVYAGLSCLKEAREESKNTIQSNIFQFNQFNQLTDEELLAKKKQLERKILDIKKVEVEIGEVQSV